MSLEYKIIDPRNNKNYNGILLNSKDYSVFHSENWARVISESYNYVPLYLSIENNNQFDILFPIMRVNSFLTGKRLVSLTFSDFCEPIISNNCSHSFNDIFQQIILLGKKSKVKYIEFNTTHHYLNDGFESKNVFGHELDLTQTESELFNGFRKGTKSSILKAKKKWSRRSN